MREMTPLQNPGVIYRYADARDLARAILYGNLNDIDQLTRALRAQDASAVLVATNIIMKSNAMRLLPLKKK